jgi:nucleotidyltransferase substrate binding protein (TIGR01987 family)
MSHPDVRWQQRFSNYRRALEQLEGFFEPPMLNEREQQGLIKVFEYTFELAWNTLRDLLRSQGNADLLGSRDTLREAFRLGLVADGEAWMLMIQDRNLTSHTYNCSTAVEIEAHIREAYLSCFQALRSRMDQRQLEEGE